MRKFNTHCWQLWGEWARPCAVGGRVLATPLGDNLALFIEMKNNPALPLLGGNTMTV